MAAETYRKASQKYSCSAPEEPASNRRIIRTWRKRLLQNKEKRKIFFLKKKAKVKELEKNEILAYPNVLTYGTKEQNLDVEFGCY